MPAARDSARLRSEEALARLVAVDEVAVDALERALTADPDTALAVAERLATVASAESARLLARMESGADKDLRRAVRRALYRLKQRGVDGGDAPAASAAPARAVLGGPDLEGFLSFGDPFGDRLLWILKLRPGGGVLHFSAIVNEPAGLREAVFTEVTHKSLQTLREELERRHGMRLVEVDWHYCDWIAAEGYARTRARDDVRQAIARYPQLRLQLTTSAAAPTSLPLPADLSEESLSGSAALLEEPEMRRWFLPETVLSADLARYREIRDSPLVLDRSSQMARIEEIIQGAVDAVFAGERAAAWARRLRESSYFFSRTGRVAPAARAAAVAAAIESRGGGRGIPFCDELVRRSFGMFLAAEAEREREDKATSVLVTPDDLRATRAQGGPTRPRRP